MENNNIDITLLSIGIPTYNRPVGLKRTIEHMLNQNYQNLEIIISDNNSENPWQIKAAIDKVLEVDLNLLKIDLIDYLNVIYSELENLLSTLLK